MEGTSAASKKLAGEFSQRPGKEVAAEGVLPTASASAREEAKPFMASWRRSHGLEGYKLYPRTGRSSPCMHGGLLLNQAHFEAGWRLLLPKSIVYILNF